MRTALPPPLAYHGTPPTHVPANLASTGYVYVQRDGYRKPLTHPYFGQFSVLQSNDMFFTLDINGRQDTVSVDCLKVAYVPPSGPKTDQ